MIATVAVSGQNEWNTVRVVIAMSAHNASSAVSDASSLPMPLSEGSERAMSDCIMSDTRGGR